MLTTLNAPPNGNGKHLNNYRIFRPQAVEASATRQTGEPWAARIRLESWIIAGLTLIATAAAVIIFRGGH
jgi:apolipoprotein N-acyltransferase